MVGKVGRDFKNLRICYMIKKGFGGLASENVPSRFNLLPARETLGVKVFQGLRMGIYSRTRHTKPTVCVNLPDFLELKKMRTLQVSQICFF